jgi:hypothetical protein
MLDSYVVHIHRHAHDTPQYITGHIEIAGTDHRLFFSSYDSLLRALSDTVSGSADEPPGLGHGRHHGGSGQHNTHGGPV